MRIPDHLSCLLRNLHAGQKTTVRNGHGTDWFQTGKGVRQDCILSPCLFNFYAEYIIWNARLDEASAGIKIAGRNINNLRYADDTLMAESKEELKSLLMKVKEQNETATSPIISWQMDGETVETVTDFIFGAPKWLQMLTAAMKLKDTCSLWKSYDQPRQHIKKQRHYFANKGPSSQSYGFSSSHVWMWELDYKESWAPKNWCFWTVVLEKTFESPLDCKEIQPIHPIGNQSWVFIDAEAETPILWPPDVKS